LPVVGAVVDRNQSQAAKDKKLGDALYWHKRYTDAEPFFRKAVLLEPANPVYQYGLGRDLLWAKRYSDAEPYLRTAVLLAPQIPFYEASLGADLWHQQRYQEAEPFLRKAADLQVPIRSRGGSRHTRAR
jgi:tetratricopeptide (TPR) repeat protein